MTSQPSGPRATRSESPSAKFYSRTFSRHTPSGNEGQGPTDEDMTASAPHSKRRKLNPGSDAETAAEARIERYQIGGARVSHPTSSRQRDATKPKRAVEVISGTRAPRVSSGSAYTKRASALNLHNYPTDHHPAGIAIWVIQKIDSARRERTDSTSSRDTSPEAFSAPSSSTAFIQAPGQASDPDDGEDPVDRRQAQRERKIKQRLENWAKSKCFKTVSRIVANLCCDPDKENDVVARAKLDAKKKFGSNPSTEPILLGNGQIEKPSPSDEKDAYIRRRIRDDFSRLMNRQTKVFADDISKLQPFQTGFSKECFPAASLASGSDANSVTAGRLLVNVLPALAEKQVSRTSQLAADDLIHALETGSLSPESFFDAVAILAENRDILEGTDRVLAQLFSRSSSSGNTKALRTSSGAESKLFATTNGPFIIYNTIENTETIASGSSRRSARSAAIANSAPARASPRERRPTAKLLGISEVSTRPQSRTSMSPRTSPPKVPKLIRPSKLRGSMSFAKSPSPPQQPVKLTEQHVSATSRGRNGMKSVSRLVPPAEQRSVNQYQWSRAARAPAALADQPCLQIEIKNDPVQNLLDLALFASQLDTDDDSDLNDTETGILNGGADTYATIPFEPSATEHNDDQGSSNLHKSLKLAADGYAHASLPDLASAVSLDQNAKFMRIVQLLPTSETNLSPGKIKEVAALYDQLAQGPAFENAKAAGISYPEIPRPFTDEDGWKLTGVVNEFGEEIVEIDHHKWVNPAERVEKTQQPLRRLKRKAQLEQERVFGFPPVAGYGNEPRHKRQKLRNEENVAYEKFMFHVRKAAETRGLPCDKTLTWEQLAELIKSFDSAHGITFDEAETADFLLTIHDDADDGISSRIEVSEVSEMESDDDSDYEPDATINADPGATWTDIGDIPRSAFVAVNGRRESRRLRGRPSSPQSSAGRNRDRAMDLSTILGVRKTRPDLGQPLTSKQPTQDETSPPFRHTASSPPGSTKYDIRPPTTFGTFNTFNGPITSSNTPTASPAGTPSFMKLNFSTPSIKPSSTSPAPTTAMSATRRLSTASTSTSSPSLASRLPSTQPLDIDNTNAYHAAKGYQNTNTNTNSSSSAPGSPNGLNGGFPGGGIIINAPDKRGDGRGQRRKSKAPDFKMSVQRATKEGPRVQAKAVRGGTVLKFG
jgi:hypothetical protein